MGIQSVFGSIASVLTRNPLPWGIVAGLTAKATQVAVSSFFRASPRFISLIARASSIPGGSALVNYGPSVLIALATGALLRYWSTSIKPIISAAAFQNPFTYVPTHSEVDRAIQGDAATEGRSLIYCYPESHRTAYFCSNYPKQGKPAYETFCDAFGYADNNTIQIAAIANGCGWGGMPQLLARVMVDNFINALPLSKTSDSAESLVMQAAQNSQKQIEKNHDEFSTDNYYGGTTFLGGLIFKATDGKRYFTGVNCGDCKLYRLSKGQFTEVTTPARINAGSSGGRFGPGRLERDKTEYLFSIEIQLGDSLFFMTDGVHDNLDRDPPEEGTNETLGAADQRKLSTLQKLPQDEELGQSIMDSVYDYSAKYLNEAAKGTDMRAFSAKDFPGKPDHMTLLVVQVR